MMLKKVITLILSALMLMTLIPVSVWAGEADHGEERAALSCTEEALAEIASEEMSVHYASGETEEYVSGETEKSASGEAEESVSGETEKSASGGAEESVSGETEKAASEEAEESTSEETEEYIPKKTEGYITGESAEGLLEDIDQEELIEAEVIEDQEADQQAESAELLGEESKNDQQAEIAELLGKESENDQHAETAELLEENQETDQTKYIESTKESAEDLTFELKNNTAEEHLNLYMHTDAGVADGINAAIQENDRTYKTTFSSNILFPDVTTAGENCDLLGLEGSYTGGEDKALARINEIRYEACKEGVINPATGKALTLADYKPLKWSSGLEYIARIRAAEASMTMGHVRTDGTSCFNITAPDSTTSCGEVLAWNWSSGMLTGIEQWYEEKYDYINGTEGAVTGHYEILISTYYDYVGVATFCSSLTTYYNSTAGQFAPAYTVGGSADESMLGAVSNCLQLLNVCPKNTESRILGSQDLGFGVNEKYVANVDVNIYSSSFGMVYTHDLMPYNAKWSLDGKESITINDYTISISQAGLVNVSDSTGLKETKVSIKAEGNNWSASKSVYVGHTYDYTITYNLNGGTNNEKNPEGFDKTHAAITLYSPTRTGCSFGGWYTNENCTGTAVTKIKKNYAKNVTLYAKWTANTYFITYNLNGGSNNSKNVYVRQYGKAVTLYAPTRTGYTFGGWYTDENCSGTAVTKIKKTYADSVTLYAKWTVNTYKITYNLNGGINNSKNVTTRKYGKAVTLYNPTRTGYTFGGWYTNKSCTGTAVTKIKKTYTKNVTLYAKWTVNTYKITYKLNGGSNSSKNVTTRKYGKAVTLYNPTRTGYTFGGWYTDKSCTGTAVTKIKKTYAKNVTLYAKWTANTYTIKFNANGGTGTMASKTMTYDTVAKLTKNSFTRTGYTFSGWSTTKKGSVVYKNRASVKNLTAKSGGSITLYAVWTKK